MSKVTTNVYVYGFSVRQLPRDYFQGGLGIVGASMDHEFMRSLLDSAVKDVAKHKGEKIEHGDIRFEFISLVHSETTDDGKD